MMYLESEKILLQKNYRGYHNSLNTTYVSNIKPTDQVIFSEGINLERQKCWLVSFPLKFSKNNYTCYFNDKKEAKNYLNNIINTYI